VRRNLRKKWIENIDEKSLKKLKNKGKEVVTTLLINLCKNEKVQKQSKSSHSSKSEEKDKGKN
jgi:protein required for attachment to host cells